MSVPRSPSRRLTRQLARPRKAESHRVATVTARNAGAGTVTLDLADGTTLAGVPCLAVVPAVSDVVLVLLVGDQATVLGAYV